MTRTLVDMFITLRYIANRDTDDGAQRYCEFFAKDSEEWSKIVPDYWPQGVQPLDSKTIDQAWRREWCERAGFGFSLNGLNGLQNAGAD